MPQAENVNGVGLLDLRVAPGNRTVQCIQHCVDLEGCLQIEFAELEIREVCVIDG